MATPGALAVAANTYPFISSSSSRASAESVWAIGGEGSRICPSTRAREACGEKNRPKMASCPSAPDDRGTRSPSRTQTALVTSPIRSVTQPGPTRPNNEDKDAVLTSDAGYINQDTILNNRLFDGRPEVRQGRRPRVRHRRRSPQPRPHRRVAQPRGPRRRFHDGLADRTQFS